MDQEGQSVVLPGGEVNSRPRGVFREPRPGGMDPRKGSHA